MATLKELRERRRLTQEELARALDVSASTIARIEQGKSLPRPKLQRRLASLFGIDADAITWPKQLATGGGTPHEGVGDDEDTGEQQRRAA